MSPLPARETIRTGRIASASSGLHLTLLTLGIGVLAGSASPLMAVQETTRISDRPVCTDCDLRWRPVVRLGGVSDPVGVGNLPSVVVGDDGYWVASRVNRGQLAVFDRTGTFDETVGGSGEGPGEFRGEVALAVDRRGRVYAVETTTGRFSVFSPRADLLRSGRLSGSRIYDFAVAEDGTLFVSAPQISADSIRAVLKVDSLGETVATFGGVSRGTSGSRLDEHFREIAVGRGNGVWTVGHTDYVVEKWTRDGSLIDRWKRMPDWFSTGEGQASGKGAGAPRILSARLDREGRLWTFTAVADEEAGGRRDAGEGDRLLAHRRYDTVVEVLDPEAGRLIAQKRFDRLLRVTGDGRYVFAVERAEAGNHQISLGALELVAP